MNSESSNNFLENGLVIEKDRVLTYSKLICPLECRYCFVESLNNGQQKKVSYLSDEQLKLLNNLPNEVKSIMLGCDTEFLQNKQEALNILEKLAVLGKNISVITKLIPDKDFIDKLSKINDIMLEKGNIFTFSISIPCVNSSSIWEPKVPSPDKRINLLNNIKNSGLNCMVAIRPLIPNLDRKEIDYIIEKTKGSVFGYYSGPLYIKQTDNEVLSLIDFDDPDISFEKVQPEWMPPGNIFLKIENKKLMDYLINKAKQFDKPVFEGAADGIDYLLSKKI